MIYAVLTTARLWTATFQHSDQLADVHEIQFHDHLAIPVECCRPFLPVARRRCCLLMSHFKEETIISIFALPIQTQFELHRRAGSFRVRVVEDQLAIMILSDLYLVLVRTLYLDDRLFHDGFLSCFEIPRFDNATQGKQLQL